MIVRAVCILFLLLTAGLPASAQESRVVALVITVGQAVERANAVQKMLQKADAETLRVDNPNNSQMRSILLRFARQAANSRAAVIYIDAPIVEFQKQSFVLPAGAQIQRGTDLLTAALPLQAFSRSAAQSGQGGVTIVTPGEVPANLPETTQRAKGAPGPVSSVSPILFGSAEILPEIVATFETRLANGEAELSTLLRRISILEGVSISEFPKQPVFLHERPNAEPQIVDATNSAQDAPEASAFPVPAIAVPVDDTPQPVSAAADAPAGTLEDLISLENSLSGGAKRSVQAQLRDLGHYNGLIDGVFGPQTRAAIALFQAERNETETGILTPSQLDELGS